jgi:hypothetical protein
MNLAGDWMFWTSILINSDVVFVAKPLNFFREAHSDSQRDKTRRHGLELMEGLDIYSVVATSIPLDQKTKKNVLLEQVKVWGTLACTRRLAWNTNRNIYNKLLFVHPELQSKPISAVLLPFAFYFVSAPPRRIKSVRVIYKSFTKSMRWLQSQFQRAHKKVHGSTP